MEKENGKESEGRREATVKKDMKRKPKVIEARFDDEVITGEVIGAFTLGEDSHKIMFGGTLTFERLLQSRNAAIDMISHIDGQIMEFIRSHGFNPDVAAFIAAEIAAASEMIFKKMNEEDEE